LEGKYYASFDQGWRSGIQRMTPFEADEQDARLEKIE
jgi:hypothetical protein